MKDAKQISVENDPDQRLFFLSQQEFEAFTELLQRPRIPDPKLRALMNRRPAWEEADRLPSEN